MFLLFPMTMIQGILWVMMMVTIPGHPHIIARPGPSSGIIVQEAPGFILIDKQIITQKICTSVDPKAFIEKHYSPPNIKSVEIKEWYSMHLKRAQTKVKEILIQARKPFVPVSATKEKRPKRFVGVLIAGLIFSVLGSIVSSTISSANSVSIKVLATEIEHLQMNIKAIHHELELQKAGLMDLTSVINDTVVTVNLHSELITRSINVHENNELFKRELMLIQEPILFNTIFFINEIQNGMNDLTRGHIPLYFVTNEMIRSLLYRVSGEELEDFQVNLAFEMGSAIPLYINSENLEICFLLAIPYVSTKNVFQIKTVHNVGTWEGDIHIKIRTPNIITYQPWVPDLYTIPIIEECIRFKDINFQCIGNPFIYDTTHALCGLEYTKHGSERCEVSMQKVEDSSQVQAILVKDEWLVSTTAKNMSVYYENLIMNRVIALPSIVSLIRVPPRTRILIGKTTLYPVGTEVWEGEVENIDAFQNQNIPINPDLKFLLEHKLNHTIQMTIKKDNLSIEQFDYSEQDQLLLDSRNIIFPTEFIIFALIGMVILWLLVLTIYLIRISQKSRKQIPTILELIEKDLQ